MPQIELLHTDCMEFCVSCGMKKQSPLKGRKRSPEAIEKGRASLRMAYAEGRGPGFKKGHAGSKAWIGRKHSDETKAKMREARLKNQPMCRADVVAKSIETKRSRGSAKGSRNPNWKGGITSEQRLDRNSKQYSIWRNGVFGRDNYTCQTCGARCGNGKDVKLNAHHIKSFARHKELRFDVSNGITLCKPCHDLIPKGNQHHAYN